MNAPDKAAEIKAAVTAIAAFGTALFGWVGWLIILWLLSTALDYITGTCAAIYKRSWSSAAARQGLWHKLGSIFAVLVAVMCDIALNVVGDNLGIGILDLDGRCMITPLVAVWYTFTELGSIVENAAAMGAPIPGFLKRLIDGSKKSIDGKTEDEGSKKT